MMRKNPKVLASKIDKQTHPKTTAKEKNEIVKGSIFLPLNENMTDTKVLAKLKKITFNELKFSILLINGPNLNMLGKRDPTQYGTFTLLDAEKLAVDTAFSKGYKMDCFQSNHEGSIIDKIHEAMEKYDGIVINPGAFTHYSYAILDAIDLCELPVIETHISDISQREDFRRISVISSACCGQIKGLGIKSYSEAVLLLCDIIEKRLK